MRMNNILISATEANRTFSDILNKVYYQGKTFEIKRGREVVAKLTPFHQCPSKEALTSKEMRSFFEQLPTLDQENLELFETTIAQLRLQDKSGQTKWD